MASRRGYLTIAELEQFADITVTDATEAEDQISQAEELIDAYVGPQEKHVHNDRTGKLTAVSGTTLFDTSSDTPLVSAHNYFIKCVIEIVGGTGAGQQRLITGMNKDTNAVTVATAFDPQVDTTSIYRIFQLGKFPRAQDTWQDPDNQTYSKYIPEAVKRATAAQVAYIIEKGAAYFNNDNFNLQSESFLNYSYSRGGSGSSGPASALSSMIAPRAKVLLRGITNRTGRLINGPHHVRKYPV